MIRFDALNSYEAAECLVKCLCAGLVLFSLYTALFGVLPDIIQRGVHISAVLLLVYLKAFVSTKPVKGRLQTTLKKVQFVLLGILSALAAGYQFLFYDEVVSRYGEITRLEIPIAIIAIVLLLDATRRTIGWSMVGLAIFFLVYAAFGRHFPDLLSHRGYDLERILEQVYLGADGIYGTPLGVSATFVIVIVVLGALLEKTGASGVLMDIAVAATKKSRGGPAKSAVIGSSLMGMISGTAVANVLTTGTISIPLMRRGGYKPAVAGAVEAVASTGGQLMPPIMGAAAFLMADIMEVPYLEITKAALIPAIIFYIAVFASVHLEAVRMGLEPLDGIEVPSISSSLKRSGHVLISIPVFIAALLMGYSVMYSSLAGIICLMFLSLLRESSRLGYRELVEASSSACEAIIPVALATATAGIVIGIVTLTGLGLKFSSFIVTISGNNLVVALVLTMCASLVLGMGLPTAASYILVATLTAPALVNMGVDLMAAHMFVFYSAMLSAITPPVALAAFAAAAICREPPMRVAVISVKFGFVAFVLPYFFVLEPRLLAEGGLFEVLEMFALATIAILAIVCAIQGYAFSKLSLFERLILPFAAFALLIPGSFVTLFGVVTLLGMAAFWKFSRSVGGLAPNKVKYKEISCKSKEGKMFHLKPVSGMLVAFGLMVSSAAVAETYLSIGSNPVGNTAYQWAAGISELVNKNVPGVKAAAEGTKGYVANVQLMLDRKVEAGFSNTRLAYEAHHAQGLYQGQKPGQIVGWMSVKPIYMQVVVKADSEIKSLSDLKGKRVGMGQPGGTSMLDADLLMSTIGLTPGKDFKEFRVKLPTMVDMLGDNQLDALIWSGTPPMPPIIKLKSQHKVRFLDIPRDVSAKIMKVSPAYTGGDLKANVYADQPNEVKSYMLGNVLLIRSDVPEDVVYKATKAVMENLKFMAGVHPAWKTVQKDGIVNGFTIPVHPGALRYYREAGVAGIEDFAKRVAK